MDEVTNCRLNRRNLLGSIAMGSLVATSGCAVIQPPDLEDVNVDLAGIDSPDIGATKLRLPLIIEVLNEGDSYIPNLDITFDVSINGGHVASGFTSVDDLGANQVTKARVTTDILYREVGQQIVQALQMGSFSLALVGEIEATGPIGIFSTTRDFIAEHSVR